jgi:hypothetical protein
MKEQYISQRNAQILDDDWLWKYYKENGGILNSQNTFIDYFYNEKVRFNINGESFIQKQQRDLSKFFLEMDKKFKLTTLWDKEGNFIKVVV